METFNLKPSIKCFDNKLFYKPGIIQSVLQTLNGKFWFDKYKKCTKKLSSKLTASFIKKNTE